MSPLRIALLGSPRVLRDGAVVTFDTRKATAVLAYLAVTGSAHSRDTLCALLWPQQRQESARGALRRTLSVLNSATGGEALDARRATVGLRPDAVERFDVAELREAVDRPMHGHVPELPCPRCREPLAAVAALCRDEFMAGFSVRDSPEFDAWQQYQAAGLRQHVSTVLERLVGAHVAAGDPGAAVEPARRWLLLDPLAEPAHATLMRLYAWTGQRGAALLQYRECVRVLHEELGVSPLSSTTALEEEVRSGRVTAPSEAPQAVMTPRRRPAADVPQLPLVGRAQELAVLRGANETVAAGSGRLVVLSGEPGSGKSRLLDEAVTASVLPATSARCHRGEEQLALGVVADLLRKVLLRPGAGAARLPDGLRAEVGRLLPELAPAGSRPPPLDSPGAQNRFRAALVTALVSCLAEGRPAVLAVDDLHWSDETSADVLAFLVRRLRELPVLVVLTWHREALPARSPLAEAVTDAVRDGLGTTLELGRLDHDSVGTLVREALPAASDREVVERLTAETGGLPGLVIEYLEAFRLSGRPPEDEDWPLPGGVRDLLQARLAALTETTQQVLAAAAVLDPDISPGLVRATSGRAEEEVVLGLEEATHSGLLVETDRDGGTYDFRQDALRRLVYDSTSLARRRLLHGRAADALAQRRRPEAPAAVAAHLRLAGRDGESAEWSWRAAQRAVRLYAHEEALEHLAVAEAHGHSTPLVQQASGDVLTALGRYREALLAYGRAAATCPPQDRLTAATIEHRLADVHHRLGSWEVADSHLAAALDLLPDGTDPALRARVLADVALVAHRRGAAPTATAAAERALLAARSARDDAALAQAHDVLGVLAAEREDLEEAEQHLEQSLVHANRLTDVGLRVAAMNNLALVLDAAGRPEEALATAREALVLGLEHGDRHRAAALHTNLADRLHAVGKREEALEHLTAAARLFADVDDARLRRPEIWKLVHW